MAKGKLLRNSKNNPLYKIASNYSTSPALRICLNPESFFNPGDFIAQVKRSDGVLELIPEELFNAADYEDE